MTATPGEFVASLTAAFPAAVEAGRDWLVVTHGQARVRFDFQVGSCWRIGSLELPSLQVNITVLEGRADAVAALIERADRATQRGGG
jgi:hypothetical protein